MVSFQLNFHTPLRESVFCWSVTKVARIGNLFSSNTFGSCQGSIVVFFCENAVKETTAAARMRIILLIVLFISIKQI